MSYQHVLVKTGFDGESDYNLTNPEATIVNAAGATLKSIPAGEEPPSLLPRTRHFNAILTPF